MDRAEAANKVSLRLDGVGSNEKSILEMLAEIRDKRSVEGSFGRELVEGEVRFSSDKGRGPALRRGLREPGTGYRMAGGLERSISGTEK